MKEKFVSSPFELTLHPLEKTYYIYDFNRLTTLTPTALKILEYGIRNIVNNQVFLDTGNIAKYLYQEETDTLKTRVRRGIRNLVANSVIARTETPTIYWLNINVINKI